MRQKGFTLVEIMIVVAIIGILASIAYPSYMEYVRKSNRADAQAVMMEAAQFLERFYTMNGTYAGASIPAGLSASPKPGTGTAKFTISLPAANATTFTVQAAPTGGYSDTTCGTITINAAGTKTASNGTVDQCW